MSVTSFSFKSVEWIQNQLFVIDYWLIDLKEKRPSINIIDNKIIKYGEHQLLITNNQ